MYLANAWPIFLGWSILGQTMVNLGLLGQFLACLPNPWHGITYSGSWNEFTFNLVVFQVTIRPMMYIALTYDHRLIDGREAVTFLRTIKKAVEDPRVMFLDL